MGRRAIGEESDAGEIVHTVVAQRTLQLEVLCVSPDEGHRGACRLAVKELAVGQVREATFWANPVAASLAYQTIWVDAQTFVTLKRVQRLSMVVSTWPGPRATNVRREV